MTNLVKLLSRVVQELEDLVADLPTSTTYSHTSATSLAVAASEVLAVSVVAVPLLDHSNTAVEICV